METYSKEFGRLGVKRPDFMVFVEGIGSILVDVKDRKPHGSYDVITLNYDEVQMYDRLFYLSNLPVWYAVSNNDVRYKTWFWFAALRAYEVECLEKDGERFFAVPLGLFAVVGMEDGFGRIVP